MLSLLLLVSVVHADFSKLAADYWEQQMRLSPLTATFYNHPGYHDKLDDNSPAGREDAVKTLTELRKRLEVEAVPYEHQVSAELMRIMIDDQLEGMKHRPWEHDVDHMDGPQSWIPSVVEVAQPMKTREDAEALLRRMESFPIYFANHVRNLTEGVRAGRVAAKPAVEKTLRQLKELVEQNPKETPFAAAATRLPEPLRKEYLPKILLRVESHVKPAYNVYAAFLAAQYPARTNPGIMHIPGGPQAYKYQIKHHTTVDYSADELHKIGLEELASIEKEMAKIAPPGKLKELKEKPENFFKTREEIVKTAEALVAEATAKLPQAFGILPKTPLIVKPVEEYKEKNETAARYYPPPDDLSRPGIYYINTYKPETRARYTMTSLAVHEGVPGHHLQIAIAAEQRGLPAFRRQAGFTAYVEGWALYSERLADELGLYKDDLSRIGMLTDQAWRACRLVVDTGLHAKGWTREKAISFMASKMGRAEEEIAVEVDRYIIWPGQALAYKVGQRELQKLRAEASKRPGFDLRKFHDEVLRHGALPLPLLRKIVLN